MPSKPRTMGCASGAVRSIADSRQVQAQIHPTLPSLALATPCSRHETVSQH